MVLYNVLIIGGGTAGITVAAQLLRKKPTLKVGIIEPSSKHYYQPAWTLVGAGTFGFEQTERDEKQLIPSNADWIKDYATHIDPDDNMVTTKSGTLYHYDYLVVATGVQYNWDLIPGLAESIGTHGVTSNYDKSYVQYTWELLKNFKEGNALFTQPHTPIKCGGAPQKIMYLAEDLFRKKGIRSKCNVIFATPGSVIFGVQPFKSTLENIVKRRAIDGRFFHKLVEIRYQQKDAVFEVTNLGDKALTEADIDKEIGMRIEGQNRVVIPYEILHLAPPQSAPDFIKNSSLSKKDDPYGWVDVHKHTLQHTMYSNVYALGDVAGTPNAKTGAAIRKQAPVLVQHLINNFDHGKSESTLNYDGYSSCPIVTGYGKMVLAEFDYDNKPKPSFPFDTSKERWSMWLLKKYFLPWFYWNRMLKGKG